MRGFVARGLGRAKKRTFVFASSAALHRTTRMGLCGSEICCSTRKVLGAYADNGDGSRQTAVLWSQLEVSMTLASATSVVGLRRIEHEAHYLYLL